MTITLASGTRTALRFIREGNRGETPTLTPVASVAAAVGGTGTSTFTRATGSWVTDGYVAGMRVRSAGFTLGPNNGDWVVTEVSATDLKVADAGDVIAVEVADVSQTITPLWQTLRATGRNINLEKNVLESAEVDADGQETDVRHGFNRVVGSPGFQLSLQDYDDIIELAMGGTWTTVAAVTPGNISISSVTKKITRVSGSWINDGFRPGDIVRTAAFTNPGNNADWRVTAVTALDLTVYEGTAGTIVTEAPSGTPTVTFPGKRIDVYPTLKSMSVERAFLDVGKYQVFRGVVVDQMQVNAQPEAMIGGTANLLGMSAAAMASSAAGIVLNSSGTSPLAAFDGQIFEGGTAIAVCTSVESTLQRNRSLNPVIGSKFSPDVFEGQAQFNGTLTAYFQDETLFNKFVNETESSVYMRFNDPNDPTAFLSLVMPRVKYTGGQMDPPQQGPVPLQMPFKALKKTGLAAPGSTTVNTMFSIQRSNS